MKDSEDQENKYSMLLYLLIHAFTPLNILTEASGRVFIPILTLGRIDVASWESGKCFSIFKNENGKIVLGCGIGSFIGFFISIAILGLAFYLIAIKKIFS